VDVRWIDLVDPTPEELLASLPAQVDPEVVEVLATRPGDGAAVRPLIESHGAYIFGLFMAARSLPDENRLDYLEVGLVATTSLVVSVRKSPAGGGDPFDLSGLGPASADGAPAGILVHRLVDDVADSYVSSLDAVYGEIEELEDGIDDWPSSEARRRISGLRHQLLHSRKLVSATRGAVRRIVDGRVEIGEHALFPTDVELLFMDTTEALVRVTEELDIARELLGGVRDHHQSKVAESQGEVGKKLTVIASLVLVPSLIVGYYGQNFASAFDEPYWSIGVSTSLIVASTIAQLALYRWRRWI
jgi:Mg2+ and Co2+ transporter CorA